MAQRIQREVARMEMAGDKGGCYVASAFVEEFRREQIGWVGGSIGHDLAAGVV